MSPTSTDARMSRRSSRSARWRPRLLWLPLVFYVYSIAYGSVPVFIPQLWPHSHYNSRYGLELLPALALFACVPAAALEQRLKQAAVAASSDAATGAGRFAWTPARWLYPVALALAVVNPLVMRSEERRV